MHHFIFEFITGGGLSQQDLSQTLIKEGEMMVRTLLKELSEAGQTDVSLCRDHRLELIDNIAQQHVISSQVAEAFLPELVSQADVAWLIAPETNNCLLSLANLFIEQDNLFIGSSPDAIEISASKLTTNKVLVASHINTIETRALNDIVPGSSTGWIIKPDDGVGGEDCYFIDDVNKLSEKKISYKSSNMIVQPYIKGESMSMSLLVYGSDFRLLACNKQYIEIKDTVVCLTAIGVNECLQFKEQMMILAKKIIDTISGFAGYIGIDVIESNNELLVLDINPRFTTAYAGISESLGLNITAEILNTFLNKKLPNIELTDAVPIKVNI
jgi:predicted ATP-grasp superfamily ATP-dependent carboligase